MPANETARLEALRRYEVLDTPAEPEFDELTALASYICGTPVAFMSLVDERRQWFKSRVGSDVAETPREVAFCAHTVALADLLVVPDALEDERFRDNPLVTGGPGIRFYAGAPLVTPGGHALGSLCVVDQIPHELSPHQKQALRVLANQVVHQLELRDTLRRLREALVSRDCASAALRENELRFFQYLEALPVGVFVIDAAGKPMYGNRACENILGKGIRPDASTGKLAESYRAYRRGTNKLYPLREMPIVRALQGEASSVDDIEVRREDRVIPIEATATPIFSEDGAIVGAIAAFQDITERRQAEQLMRSRGMELETLIAERTAELAIARDRALEASRAKSAFLGRMSHELRTPLNHIIGYSDLLLDEAAGSADGPALDPLRRIRSAADQLTSLIGSILDFTHLDSGGGELSVELFAAAALVFDVTSASRPQVEKNGSSLVVEAPEDLGTMRTDLDKLRRILMAILGNAAKFTQRGTVTVRARREAAVPCDRLVVEISDTGIGMAPAETASLFGEFQQADESLTRRFGGAGLGLAISLRFCRLLGGDIEVRSEAGKGSTFLVRVPVDAPAPAAVRG